MKTLPKHLYSAKTNANAKIKTWTFIKIGNSGEYAHYESNYNESTLIKINEDGSLDLRLCSQKLTKDEVIDSLIAKLQKRIDQLEKQRD